MVCKSPDGDGLPAFFQIMKDSAEAGNLVRVLVKFSVVDPPPFMRECPLDGNTGVYALGLALVVSCHAHNSSFTLQLRDNGQ